MQGASLSPPMHTVFCLNFTLIFVSRSVPVLLFIRFDAEIIVFDGCILFIRHCVDIKEVKRFNERDELFEAEVTDIKVGKLLIQKIAESPRKIHPSSSEFSSVSLMSACFIVDKSLPRVLSKAEPPSAGCGSWEAWFFRPVSPSCLLRGGVLLPILPTTRRGRGTYYTPK